MIDYPRWKLVEGRMHSNIATWIWLAGPVVFPLDRRITIVARVRTRELFAFVPLLTRGHNYNCC